MFRKIHTDWSLDARSKGARAERLTNLVKTVVTLSNDLAVMGDVEGALRLYVVTGDRQDPEARFAGNIPTNYPMIQSLQAAYDAEQLKVDDQTLGFVIAGRAYRHLTFDEYFQRDPDMMDKILRKMRSENGDLKRLSEADEEKFKAKAKSLMKRYYHSQIVPNLPNPVNLPENMRVHAQVLSVLMRDQMSFVIHRDTETHIDTLDAEDIGPNPELSALWQFLHGLRPDRVADPFQAVEDYKTLTESLKSDG